VYQFGGVCEFTGESTLRRETVCFFSGNVAPEVRRLFPQVRASIWESCRQKVQRTVARARFALQNRKKTDSHRALLDEEAGKMGTSLYRPLGFAKKKKKTGMFGAASKSPHC
jgi:hypothetical protein